MIGSLGRPQGHGQHNPGFHGVPPSAPRERGFQSALGMGHGGGPLTCGELDLGTHPATADLGAPPGALGSCPVGEPARGGEPAQSEVVGGQAEQGVGTGAGGVEAVGVRTGFDRAAGFTAEHAGLPGARVRAGTGFDGGDRGEGLTVERAGRTMATQLPPVRGEGAGGERGRHRVGVTPKGAEEGGGGRVPALGTEDDGGEQPFPRAAGSAHGGGIGQRVAPERGGPQGGFVHPSFLAGGSDKKHQAPQGGLGCVWRTQGGLRCVRRNEGHIGALGLVSVDESATRARR